MVTTSLKLSEALKRRAMAAAERDGKTTHAFMVEAIERAATIAEQRAEFVAAAVAAREEALKSGKGYVAEEVHQYLRARASGGTLRKPKAKAWRA